MKYKHVITAFELLKKFPATIKHSKLDYIFDTTDPNNFSVGWVPESKLWFFVLLKEEDEYILRYETRGFEGAENFLPIQKDVLKNCIQNKILNCGYGLHGKVLEDLIFEMWDWLKEENLV
jgi:hypothetical protein